MTQSEKCFAFEYLKINPSCNQNIEGEHNQRKTYKSIFPLVFALSIVALGLLGLTMASNPALIAVAGIQ